MNLLFDTSALVKMLVPEDGTELVTRLWAMPTRKLISALGIAEAHAALAAAERAGRLDTAEGDRGLSALARLSPMLDTVPVTEVVAWAAGQLARERALSGADAVHLATAISISDDESALVTFDRRLALAALSCGVNVVPDPGG